MNSRPFLRWAGSKRQLLPKLTVYWRPDFKRYVEPFMGSACLFFAIQPRRAILSDLNANLVNTFLAVRDDVGAVATELCTYPLNKERYYELRALDPTKMFPVQAAARFIYLNRFCFNGLYRTNLDGHFNVPFASSGTGKLPDETLLRKCSSLLKHASIESCDFSRILTRVRKGDFIYLDPPYAVQNRRVFREYSSKPFDSCDLDRLAEALLRIDSVGASFVVSYADCAEGREALAAWHPVRVRTKRFIAGFSKHRRHAYELLATNISKEARRGAD